MFAYLILWKTTPFGCQMLIKQVSYCHHLLEQQRIKWYLNAETALYWNVEICISSIHSFDHVGYTFQYKNACYYTIMFIVDPAGCGLPFGFHVMIFYHRFLIPVVSNMFYFHHFIARFLFNVTMARTKLQSTADVHINIWTKWKWNASTLRLVVQNSHSVDDTDMKFMNLRVCVFEMTSSHFYEMTFSRWVHRKVNLFQTKIQVDFKICSFWSNDFNTHINSRFCGVQLVNHSFENNRIGRYS